MAGEATVEDYTNDVAVVSLNKHNRSRKRFWQADLYCGAKYWTREDWDCATPDCFLTMKSGDTADDCRNKVALEWPGAKIVDGRSQD